MGCLSNPTSETTPYTLQVESVDGELYTVTIYFVNGRSLTSLKWDVLSNPTPTLKSILGEAQLL